MDEKKKAHAKAVAKYNAKNIKQVKLNLNKKTDADIIEKLENCGNIQGYVKDLIRKDMNDDSIIQDPVPALQLKIIEGDFKENEFVVVSIDGKEFRRKVYYSNKFKDLVIIIYGNEYAYSEFMKGSV